MTSSSNLAHRRSPLKTGAQRFLFTAERFAEHEMANHAAAGAYAFLLSATPAVLLILGLARALLRRYPRAFAEVEGLVSSFLGPLAAGGGIKNFLSSGLGGGALVFGAVSLIWAARLFIVTIQRSLRLIHAPSGRNKPVKDNFLTFAIELACLVSVVALLAVAQVARVVLAREGGGPAAFLASPLADALRALLGAAPALALYTFVYATYRFIPAAKPRRSTAAIAAAFCMAAFWIVSSLVQLFASGSRYELLYGVFGSLIVLLVNVYTFFTLYLYCAEYAYVAEHFDALLFGRFFRVSKASGATRIEKALFMAPERLLKAYARNFAAGETVFAAGSEGREAYFVYSGEVGVYLGASGEGGGERQVAGLGPGEVIGEMAALLDEPRTATARAERDSTLFVLPPAVFRHFLRSDAEAARRIIDSLSQRLKETNRRLAVQDRAATPARDPSARGPRRKNRRA